MSTELGEPSLAMSQPPSPPLSPVPAGPRLWVARSRLTALLEESRSWPVTLVVAPAGAGKTTSVAAWSRSTDRMPVSWVRSGAQVAPGELAGLLLATADVAERGRDLTALHGAAARSILVVDDAHLLPSAAFRLVDEVLATSPNAVRLVLLCRWDPPLRKLEPTLEGKLRVLRGDVLRLTDVEARRLVRLHGPGLPDESVDVILERSSGWAAVLALAARTVAAAPDPVAAAGRLADPGLGVADLLANQVFATLDDRTRHLLLCIAGEESATAAAALALTGDPGADALLHSLADSGLLVLREEAAQQDGLASEPVFRVHPLLGEVTRRRLYQGGVAVSQARATVRRAALSDLARGQVPVAFTRLVRAQAWADAVAVMATRGDELVTKVTSQALAAVAEAAPELVYDAPRAWIPLALDRWTAADPIAASYWIRRVQAHPGEATFAPVELALLRLLSARMGGESPEAAVEHARRVADVEAAPPAAPSLFTWLLLELGVAEAWLGGLTEAHGHLRWAAAVAEPVSRQLLAAALSQLAQTEFLLGHHRSAEVLTTRLLARVPSTAAMNAVTARAYVVRDLVMPRPESSDDLLHLASVSFPPALDDPMTRALRAIWVARRLYLTGAFEDSAVWLELPEGMPPPPHVRARLALERCVPAMHRQDAESLSLIRAELASLQADAEAALVDAFLAELRDDPAEAAEALVPAAAGQLRGPLPHTRTSAAVFRAQLLDQVGHPADALGVLQEAIDRTAPQRVARPFLGVSVRGTPTPILLRRLSQRCPSPWLVELERAVSAWSPADSRPAEPDGTAYHEGTPHPPALTRREREVLAELARGSTYADIAAALYVTENTVKTHVSAAYAKLGVSRRSQALKVARTLGLV